MPLEGIKSYNPKIVAYRNDFCVSCDAPCRAHQIRTFKAFQIYYISVLPLGFWREWKCSDCGKDPHVYSKQLRNYRWVGVLLSGLFAIAGVVTSFDEHDSIATKWVLRLLFPAVFIAALWFALNRKPDRALREKLREVSPDLDTTCAMCSGALIQDHGWRCSQCGVERTEVA